MPQVLYEAQRHSVDEIAITRGQPVTFHGEQGALVLGEMLGSPDISEALSQVLAPEQQAELAVTGRVEFHVDGYDEWSLLAQSAEDGVVIRGRIRSASDGSRELGTPLDLPPLQPFEPDPGADISHSGGSVLETAGNRATRWDAGLAGDMPKPASRPNEPPSAPSPRTPDDLEARPIPPAEGSVLGRADEAIDFALVGPPTSKAEEDAAPVDPGSKAEEDAAPVDPTSTTDVAPAERLTTPLDSEPGTRPTLAGHDTLTAHVGALGPGVLVYLSGRGIAERLLDLLDGGFDVIDDDSWASVTTRPLEALPPERGYLVRTEDPSRCLPWLLRRLEEGACVVVESRARTPAGARRMLLGADATPHLIQWVDVHTQRWLHLLDNVWRLEPM